MSLERDLQSNLAVIGMASVVIDEVETLFSSTVIDTQGFRNLMVIVTPSRTINDTPTDDFRITFEDSPDNVTFTAVNESKVLPTRNYDANGQLIFTAETPYETTYGLTSVERYIKIGVVGTTVPVACTFALEVVMEAEDKAFHDYDPNYVPVDGLP